MDTISPEEVAATVEGLGYTEEGERHPVSTSRFCKNQLASKYSVRIWETSRKCLSIVITFSPYCMAEAAIHK